MATYTCIFKTRWPPTHVYLKQDGHQNDALPPGDVPRGNVLFALTSRIPGWDDRTAGTPGSQTLPTRQNKGPDNYFCSKFKRLQQ